VWFIPTTSLENFVNCTARNAKKTKKRKPINKADSKCHCPSWIIGSRIKQVLLACTDSTGNHSSRSKGSQAGVGFRANGVRTVLRGGHRFVGCSSRCGKRATAPNRTEPNRRFFLYLSYSGYNTDRTCCLQRGPTNRCPATQPPGHTGTPCISACRAYTNAHYDLTMTTYSGRYGQRRRSFCSRNY